MGEMKLHKENESVILVWIRKMAKRPKCSENYDNEGQVVNLGYSEHFYEWNGNSRRPKF